MIHEDERRTLEDWPEAKIITAKTFCKLGNHYHKIKTEKFILVSGSATLFEEIPFKTDTNYRELKIGELITILPNVRHTFEIKDGSVLIGLCSHPFDPSDDYKI